MADKKISQLDSTTSINTGAMFPLSQTEGESLKTVKGTVDQIGDYIAKEQDHLTLNTSSKKIIGAINEILAGSIEGTASGSVASFADGGDNIPVKSLVADITAVQAGSGTPSPSNVRAISGFDNVEIVRSGKNIWNEQWEVGTINDTTGLPVSSTTQIRSKNFCSCKGGITYYICVGTNNDIRVCWYDKNQNYISQTGNISNATATSPVNALYFKIRSTNAYGAEYKNDIGINYPSTATTYEQYKGTTYTISLGSTVYGGTLDVTKGILTVDKTCVTLDPSATWIKNAEITASNSFTSQPFFTNYKREDGLCSHFGVVSSISATEGIYFGSNINIFTPLSLELDTVEKFTQWITGKNIQVLYSLLTPVVVQLTPTEVVSLLGENNIYANSGDVEVEYFNEDASQFNDLIETIITSSCSDYHVYSSNEKVVGRWIDGKPIYEKTLTNIAVQSSLNQMVDDSISYGTLIDGSINIANGVGFAYVQDNDIFLRAYVSSNKLYVAKSQATDWAGRSYAFIYVRYTKSTD